MGTDNSETSIQDAGRGSLSAHNAPETLPKSWPMMAPPPISSSGRSDEVAGATLAALNEAFSLFAKGALRDGMQLQQQAVSLAQRTLKPLDWSALRVAINNHPIKEILHQDPFTRRSYCKPRGYAGDAVLLDYIYGYHHPEHELRDATPVGRWIYNYNSNTTASRAVRRRLHLLTELIDREATQVNNARIMSIACGHLREASLSHAVRSGIIKEILAFDQDEQSLDTIKCNPLFENDNIVPVCGSIRRMLANQYDFGTFNIVYAAGLYDYLDSRSARRLTKIMFEMLRPGGALLIANFLPEIYDIGYMETFMGWNLIFRTPEEIQSSVGEIEGGIASTNYFEESERNIGLLLVRKQK